MPVDTQAFMTAWKGKQIDGNVSQSPKFPRELIFDAVTQRSLSKLGMAPQSG